MSDDGKIEFSVYVTAGAWYGKSVEVPAGVALDRATAFVVAMAAHPFPVNVSFGEEREPIEVDIVDVSEGAGDVVALSGGGWNVRLLAHVHGCGTFLHRYVDADEASDDGVNLFPGWPDELGTGWSFQQGDYVEVDEVEDVCAGIFAEEEELAASYPSAAV